MKRWAGPTAVAISGGLLLWLIRSLDVSNLWQVALRANPWALACVCVCSGLLPLAATCRWLGVLRAAGAEPVGFWTAFRATMHANLLNTFLPAKGGDVARVLAVRRQVGLPAAGASIVIERLTDLLVLGLLALGGYLVCGTWIGLVLGLPLLVAVLAAFVLIPRCVVPGRSLCSWLARLAGIVRDAGGLFRSWLRDPVALGWTVLGSALVWGLACASLGLLVLAVDASVSPVVALAVLPVASLAGMVPVSVGGLGTRDVAVVAVLAEDMGPEQAAAVALGYTILQRWFLGVLAVPFVLAAGRGKEVVGRGETVMGG